MRSMRTWCVGGALALALGGAAGCPGSVDSVSTSHPAGSGGTGSGTGPASGSSGTGPGSGGAGGPACTDGKQGGDETDVDCGGGCPPCAMGQGCAEPGDCLSGICAGGTCAAPAPWSKSFGDASNQYGN